MVTVQLAPTATEDPTGQVVLLTTTWAPRVVESAVNVAAAVPLFLTVHVAMSGADELSVMVNRLTTPMPVPETLSGAATELAGVGDTEAGPYVVTAVGAKVMLTVHEDPGATVAQAAMLAVNPAGSPGSCVQCALPEPSLRNDTESVLVLPTTTEPNGSVDVGVKFGTTDRIVPLKLGTPVV